MSNEILQGNEKIARFMGEYEQYKIFFTKPCPATDVMYHNSWDWLMPVVEKIETMIVDVPVKYQRGFMKNTTKAPVSVDTFYDERPEFIGWVWNLHFNGGNHIAESNERTKTKIESMYQAVVSFIDWYTLNVTPS